MSRWAGAWCRVLARYSTWKLECPELKPNLIIDCTVQFTTHSILQRAALYLSNHKTMGDYNYGGSDDENQELKALNVEVVSNLDHML